MYAVFMGNICVAVFKFHAHAQGFRENRPELRVVDLTSFSTSETDFHAARLFTTSLETQAKARYNVVSN